CCGDMCSALALCPVWTNSRHCPVHPFTLSMRARRRSHSYNGLPASLGSRCGCDISATRKMLASATDIRFGSEADIRSTRGYARFTPDDQRTCAVQPQKRTPNNRLVEVRSNALVYQTIV